MAEYRVYSQLPSQTTPCENYLRYGNVDAEYCVLWACLAEDGLGGQYSKYGSTRNYYVAFDPSEYEWEIEDLSKKQAQRTESLTMLPGKIGQVVRLKLKWSNCRFTVAAKVLQMFTDKNVWVIYYDPYVGGYNRLKMYCGNRQVNVYNSQVGVCSNISFDLISIKGKSLYTESADPFN